MEPFLLQRIYMCTALRHVCYSVHTCKTTAPCCFAPELAARYTGGQIYLRLGWLLLGLASLADAVTGAGAGAGAGDGDGDAGAGSGRKPSDIACWFNSMDASSAFCQSKY